MEDLAGERSEVLEATVGIRALDPRDAFRVVAAVQEPLHGGADARQTELPQPGGKLSIVAREEIRVVGAEQSLEGAYSSLTIDA
jgi:hypothetical protein